MVKVPRPVVPTDAASGVAVVVEGAEGAEEHHEEDVADAEGEPRALHQSSPLGSGDPTGR